MLIRLLRWAIFALSLSVLLVYFKGGTAAVKGVRRSVAATGGHSYLAMGVVMIAAGLSILATQLLVCLGAVEPAACGTSLWIALPGALLVAVGILGAYWVRHRYLGRFWSETVEIHKDHQVIETGPYGAVRHPLYALAIPLYAGVALGFPLWWNWIACGVMIASYVWLAAYEDRFLAENLAGYPEYQQRTRYRLVPGIW